MYYAQGVHQLTHSQIKKMLKGLPVRIRSGTHHTIRMREDQIKKLHSAQAKGKGISLTLDPYAIDSNHHLHGEGIGSMIKSGLKKLGHKIVDTARKEARPALHKLLQAGVSAVSQYAPELAPVAQHFGNMAIDKAGHKLGFGIHKHHKKAGRPRKGGALYPPGV